MISSRIYARTGILAAAMTLAAGIAAAPPARAAVAPDYTCPQGDVCFFSGTNYDGTPYPVKVAGKAGTIIDLRSVGVQVPWGSVSNRNSNDVVNIYNQQCSCNGFGLIPGQRESPGSPYTADGHMIVES